MQLVDETNAAEYLRATGRVSAGQSVSVKELSGGVSNVVLYVRVEDGADFVLKQAREQLRVADPWFCSVERIWREVEVLRVCEQVLGAEVAGGEVSIPRLLFEDRERFLFAMTAAPPGHTTWKQRLLAGHPEPHRAAACGRLLGTLHGRTWRDPAVAATLADRQFFRDLRVDPYYGQIRARHPDLAAPLDALIASLDANVTALVHGDFSPKNLLVFDDRLMLIDFEVGHFGDPAFDLGFFLTHLVLKTLRAGHRWPDYAALIATFWSAYETALGPHVGAAEYAVLVRRGLLNLSACLLARIDGKSKIEYLDDTLRSRVRTLARAWIVDPPTTVAQAAERLTNEAGRVSE